MKIALCLKGNVGNRRKYGLGKMSLELANLGFNHWKENLLALNDTDVFFHNWNPEFEKELIEMYNPRSHICEKQINFPNCPSQRHFAIKSSFYSCKKVVDLMASYSNLNNIKYDVVVLSRFDLALQKPVNFIKENLDLDRVYHHGPDPIHQYMPKDSIIHTIHNGQCCNRNSELYEVGDLFFVASSSNIYKLTRIYDNLDKMMGPSVSSHRLCGKQLKNIGLFESKGLFLEQKRFNEKNYFSKEDGDVPLVRWAYDSKGLYKEKKND
jgi:hypothetical protein